MSLVVEKYSFIFHVKFVGINFPLRFEGPLQNDDRQLYFHSLASVREGSVPTSILRNNSLFKDDEDSSWDLFAVSDPARSSQSASEDVSENGVMFFGLLSELSLACWNSHTPFTPENIHIAHKVILSSFGSLVIFENEWLDRAFISIFQDNETLQFLSGVKVIGDSVWILSNQLQNFIAGTTRPTDVKYRILTGSVSQLIYGTGCDLRSADAGFSVFDISPSRANNFDLDRLVAASESRPLYFASNVEGSPNRQVSLRQDGRPTSLSSVNNYLAQFNSWRRTFTIPRYNEANIFNF